MNFNDFKYILLYLWETKTQYLCFLMILNFWFIDLQTHKI